MQSLPMILNRFTLVLVLGFALITGNAHSADRLVAVTFELNEARYDDQGRLLGHFPLPDVKIQVRPDQWTNGNRSRIGFSVLSDDGRKSEMKNLLTEVPSVKPLGTAFGHLELVGSQPWGHEEKYFLWQHGYSTAKHDAPFEVERHQPSKVTLVPVKYRADYYYRIVRPFESLQDPSRSYFSSLVSTEMLALKFTPTGESTAKSFDQQKDAVIQNAADYWDVDPSEISKGFDVWLQRLASAPPNEYEGDKVLALAYSGDLDAAAQKCNALVASSASESTASWLLMSSQIHVALGRDLLDKASGRLPASDSRGEMLIKARDALQKGADQADQLTPPANPRTPIDLYREKALDGILHEWKTPESPPSASQKFFIGPASF